MAGDPAVVWVLDFNLCARAVVPPSSVDLTHTWGGYRILTGQVTRSHLLTKLLLFYIAETGKMLQAIRGLHSCAYWISHHREVCGKKNLLSRRQKRSIREGENFFFIIFWWNSSWKAEEVAVMKEEKGSLCYFPFTLDFTRNIWKKKLMKKWWFPWRPHPTLIYERNWMLIILPDTSQIGSLFIVFRSFFKKQKEGQKNELDLIWFSVHGGPRSIPIGIRVSARAEGRVCLQVVCVCE